MFSPSEMEARARAAKGPAAALAERGAKFVQLEVPDINGTVRGKIAGLKKALSPAGTALNTLTVSFRSHDEISMTPFSNLDNAFPKFVAVPDTSTVVSWPWSRDMGAVLCDLYMEDGTPCPMDARQILKNVVAEYYKLDLEPRAAVEYEFYVYEADDALLRASRYRELKTFGRGWDCYSVARFPTFEPLAKEFMTRMEGIGIDVEAFHTELGHGMLEFSMGHESPVKAADDAARSKLYFKQLCAERGLVASFMPAIYVGTGDSASGAHHHLSLWRDGKNISWDPDKETLGVVTRKCAAGMMETMVDFHLVFRPAVGQLLPPNELSPVEPGERLVGLRQSHRSDSGHTRCGIRKADPAGAPHTGGRHEPVLEPSGGPARRTLRDRKRSRPWGVRGRRSNEIRSVSASAEDTSRFHQSLPGIEAYARQCSEKCSSTISRPSRPTNGTTSPSGQKTRASHFPPKT